jgi:hypothetical protein
MSSTEPDGVNPFAEDLQAAVAPMPETPPFALRIVTAAESARGPYRGIGRFGSPKYPDPPSSLCSTSAGAFRRHSEAQRGEPRQGSGSPHDTGGPEVVNISLATGETWKDRQTGERKERSGWRRIVIFNDRIGDVAESSCARAARSTSRARCRPANGPIKRGRSVGPNLLGSLPTR